MKKYLWLLGVVGLLMPLMAHAVTARNVNARDAYRLIEDYEELYLLDVRTVEEYQQFRLDGARLIPIDQLVRRIGELPRDKPILVYCAVGSRSAQVVNYLARKGYPELYNLYGGIYSWVQSGLPVLKGAP